jgi:hypothetical protein
MSAEETGANGELNAAAEGSPEETGAAGYAPPVDRLLGLGEKAARAQPWPDYAAEFGLDDSHVPELIRLATDESFVDDPGDAFFGPIHAWRVLGQMEADEAAEPMVERLAGGDADFDWMHEELPQVLGMIGDSATPALGRLLSDPEEDLWARIAAARALERVAAHHPETRDEVTGTLIRQLGEHPANDPNLNGFLVSCLIDLEATVAAPLMEEAFQGDNVDISVAGDWEDVQVALGLQEERTTPRPHYHADLTPKLEPLLEGEPERQPASRPAGGKKSKNKRKMQKASRKRNRKR